MTDLSKKLAARRQKVDEEADDGYFQEDSISKKSVDPKNVVQGQSFRVPSAAM